MRLRSIALLIMAYCLQYAVMAQSSEQSQAPQQANRTGHSSHGPEFDIGPRERPWKFAGIGHSHFPITTSNPDVQMWFDQGETLLHSFWYYEAERAFRWCLRLDPDCAMAYWGLARSSEGNARSAAFIKEAMSRRSKVTERERLYIEAWAARWQGDQASASAVTEAGLSAYKSLMQNICVKYPEDVEAQLLLALAHITDIDRDATESVLQGVISRVPDHPGAHHYRIHLWDKRKPEILLDSCRLYSRIAQDVGHGQHMVGHVYSSLGMWAEAARVMDKADLIELAYLRDHHVLPFSDWSYAHNLSFMGYVQEQLGMEDAAIKGAQELIALPLDPKYNNPRQLDAHYTGLIGLMRALIKFERWDEILDRTKLPWGDTVQEKVFESYADTVANFGLGRLPDASEAASLHRSLRAEVELPANKWLEPLYTLQSAEIHSLEAVSKNDLNAAVSDLIDSAKRDLEMRKYGDPPTNPTVLYNALGRIYLKAHNASLAAECFEKTLTVVKNDGFALVGLAEVYLMLGDTVKLQEALRKLRNTWAAADPGFMPLKALRNLVYGVTQTVSVPITIPDSMPQPLNRAHNTWHPFPAPKLQVMEMNRKPLTLERYRGTNVVLIFYVGEQCPRCAQQLSQFAQRYKEFATLDTQIIAINTTPSAEDMASPRSTGLPFPVALDPTLENAKSFRAYDEFENIPLHATTLIDKQGDVWWSRAGGDPFTNIDFLLREVRRLNQRHPSNSPFSR